MQDNFGDRMKAYEASETERRFIPLLPVYARIDGRCFSRFTRGMARPFDERFSKAMRMTTMRLVEETHARIGYTQSDEISLTWLQDTYATEMLFGGKVQKWCSILSSLTAAIFGRLCCVDEYLDQFASKNPPHFDCRVFQLPNREEGANAFLWREQDATKNAISMATSAYYSPKQLDGKNGAEKQEMLFAKGINFNDYPAFFKRGTFVRRVTTERMMDAEEMERIPVAHRPTGPVVRSDVVVIEMPKFSTVTNRAAVVYDGALPNPL